VSWTAQTQPGACAEFSSGWEKSTDGTGFVGDYVLIHSGTDAKTAERATFRPFAGDNLSGRTLTYRVRIHIPAAPEGKKLAKVTVFMSQDDPAAAKAAKSRDIKTAEGFTNVPIDEDAVANSWVTLPGTFSYKHTFDRVGLLTETDDQDAFVAVDAVEFTLLN
jgi:hypothetical protein